MEVSIRCGKCGQVSKVEPEGQCSRCGEYLYQFYAKDRRKRLYLRVGFCALLTGIMLILLVSHALRHQWAPHINRAEKSTPPDPVQQDLVNYLKLLADQNTIPLNDTEKKYNKYILGLLDDDDERVILAKMGLKETPEFGTAESDAYWKKHGEKSQAIKKSKSLKERFKIERDYYQVQALKYSQITPITNEVESIHSHLIRSFDLNAKAHESFVNGMDLGYITNVKQEEDGRLKWAYSTVQKEYSDKYKEFTEAAENESNSYYRMLEQLVQKYGVLEEYKRAYPLQGWTKERQLKSLSKHKPFK